MKGTSSVPEINIAGRTFIERLLITGLVITDSLKLRKKNVRPFIIIFSLVIATTFICDIVLRHDNYIISIALTLSRVATELRHDHRANARAKRNVKRDNTSGCFRQSQ